MSSSKSHEVLMFLKDFSERQEKKEAEKLEKLEKMHQEKMKLLGDLIEVMRK